MCNRNVLYMRKQNVISKAVNLIHVENYHLEGTYVKMHGM